MAPLTLTSKTPLIEVKSGEKITIPLVLKRRSEFSGDKIQIKAIGAGFDNSPKIDLSIKADTMDVVIDLEKLKTPPGEYLIAFMGGAVAKYRHQAELVSATEAASQKMSIEVKALEAELKKLAGDVQTAPPAKKDQMTKAVAAMNSKMKSATDALNATKEKLKRVTEAAQPTDIADIVVSEPITIRIKPVEKK